MRSAARIGILAALALSACAGGDDPQEVLGTLERDRLELIAESNERLVELFVEEGERIKVDTRSGEYIERVKA